MAAKVETHKAEADQKWVESLLAQAQARRFFGKLTLIIEEGEVRRIVKEESLLPPKS